MRPKIHTRKHYVQESLSTITAGVRKTTELVEAVAVAAKVSPDHIEEGSTVGAIFLQFWYTTNDTSAGTVICIVEKLQAGVSGITAGAMAALDVYPNKKNIFYTFMGLSNPKGGVAMPIVNKWIKIPRTKQRFGLGDKLTVSILAQTGTGAICGFTTYKEQM